VQRAGLPTPRTNARVAGYEVDFVWPAQRVIVEIDGYRFHGHRSAFERDRRKGLALAGAGYTVIRISWRQLVHDPLLVAAELARALAMAA
jgi:very-short-patch-repair endonuclease